MIITINPFRQAILQHVTEAAISSQCFAVADARIPAGFDHIAAAVFCKGQSAIGRIDICNALLLLLLFVVMHVCISLTCGEAGRCAGAVGLCTLKPASIFEKARAGVLLNSRRHHHHRRRHCYCYHSTTFWRRAHLQCLVEKAVATELEEEREASGETGKPCTIHTYQGSSP